MNAIKKHIEVEDFDSSISFLKKALSLLDENLFELPILCKVLLHNLFKYCDFKTGKITKVTIEQMTRDLYVAPASGRKRQQITSDTIRNAFRTLQKFRPNEFQFSVKNQRLVIELPFIRKLYEEFWAQEKDASVKVSDNTCSEHSTVTGNNDELAGNAVVSVTDEVATEFKEALLVENINITNKHNKQTLPKGKENYKKPISSDFYPNQETIDFALSRGLTNVLNPIELQKFIKHNQENNSLWADFNPVFLRWLERDIEYRHTKQKTQHHSQGNSRSSGNDRAFNKNNSYTTAMAIVLSENRDACSPTELFPIPAKISGEINDSAHCMAMASIDCHLRPIVYQQVWNE